MAEEQLDSVTRVLTDIREKQDFDRQLTDGTPPRRLKLAAPPAPYDLHTLSTHPPGRNA